jgi:hypothetical protein
MGETMNPSIFSDGPDQAIRSYRALLVDPGEASYRDLRLAVAPSGRGPLGDHGLKTASDLLVAALASRMAEDADAGLIGEAGPVPDFALDEEIAIQANRVATEVRRQLTMRFQIYLQDRATEGHARIAALFANDDEFASADSVWSDDTPF